MEKVPNWRARYDQLIQDSQKQPFRWGEHDCAMFAARALDVQYDLGVVKFIQANHAYEGEDSAIQVIDEAGSLEHLVSDILGVDSVPPGLLSVGDVALYDYGRPDFPHALAVHDGHQLLAPGENGLTYLRLDRALKGWRL
jgi:hypothetical protein